MADRSEREALLREVLGEARRRRVTGAAPDFGPRKAYADWLQEYGDSFEGEQGEFISLSLRLALREGRGDQEERDRARLAELCASGDTSAGMITAYLRGRTSAGGRPVGWLYPALDALQRGYWTAKVKGRNGCDVNVHQELRGQRRRREVLDVGIRHGMIEALHVTPDYWARNGPQLCSIWPVLEVRLIGRVPASVGAGALSRWEEGQWAHGPACVPKEIHQHLPAGGVPMELMDAQQCLSHACLGWAEACGTRKARRNRRAKG